MNRDDLRALKLDAQLRAMLDDMGDRLPDIVAADYFQRPEFWRTKLATLRWAAKHEGAGASGKLAGRLAGLLEGWLPLVH